ncbi:HEAT repeat domain-containing protein [Myxococcaceae bacterium JPH2]|nr:HEAT repeat domain-containing protein [Myxococcaceae bacterium JPH2]
MLRNSSLVALVAATLLFALGIVFLPRLGLDSARAPTGFAVKPDWVPGTRYAYALHWQSLQRVPSLLPQGQGTPSLLEAQLRLSGTLVLRALERNDDGFVLGAALEDVAEHALEFQGQDVLPDEASVTAAFRGHEAWVELSPRGTLRAIRFAPDAPELFKQSLQWLITETFPSLPATEVQARAGAWDSAEATALGHVPAHYAMEPDASLTLRRTRGLYTQLHSAPAGVPPHTVTSEARFTFAPEGHLTDVIHQETVRAEAEDGLDTRELFQLHLRAVTRFESTGKLDLASRSEVRQPGAMYTSTDAEEKLLTQRADGLTFDTLLNDLFTHGNAGEMPENGRWLWRATGLLMLHPERCKELAVYFQDPGTEPSGQALVLDLLVGAGHAEAQAQLRRLVDDPAARRTPQAHGLLFQRLGLVAHPTPETADFVAQHLATAITQNDTDLRDASAHSLGAVVGHLSVDADPTVVARYNQVLTEGLASARAPDAQRTYLRALGNAGLAENIARVLPFADAADPGVREATATALRKTPSPDATATLLHLARAPEQRVQAAALDSLREHPLDAASLTMLRDVVVGGTLRPGSESLVANLLERRLDGGPVVVQALQALSLRAREDPVLRARVLQLLARAALVASR